MSTPGFADAALVGGLAEVLLWHLTKGVLALRRRIIGRQGSAS